MYRGDLKIKAGRRENPGADFTGSSVKKGERGKKIGNAVVNKSLWEIRVGCASEN